MSSYPMDDVLEAENDFRHLSTLINVITDMAIDAADLSPTASASDREKVANLGSMLWIARDLCDRTMKGLEGATAGLCAERAAKRMVGGERNG